MSSAADQSQDAEVKPMLADNTWQIVQTKTFVGWCNYHLAKRDIKIESLETDLSDGVALHALLEVISDQSLGKISKNARMRPQKLDNLSKSIKFINDFCKEIGVKLSFSAEDVCDGKGLLGLIWILILRYSISGVDPSAASAKAGLLLWCQKVLKPYGIPMENFTSHWQDGRAFNGLIHRFHPDYLDWNALSPENKEANLNQAFQIAEDKLAIPKLLDATDVVNHADEKSIMTYVAFFWKAFSASQKGDQAARRIAKAIARKQANDQMKSDYNARAAALNEWAGEKQGFYAVHDFGSTQEEGRQKLVDFNNHRMNDKPVKASEKLALEVLFSNLQSALAAQGCAPFEPASGLSPSELEVVWTRLGSTEDEYEKALREWLVRQKRIRARLDRFDQKAALLAAWASEKEQYLSDPNVGATLYETQGLLKQHEAFSEELRAVGPRYDALSALGQEIIGIDASMADYVNGKVQEAEQSRGNVGSLATTRQSNLEARLAELQGVETAMLEYAKATNRFNLWADDADEKVTIAVPSDSVSEVQEKLAQLAEFEQEHAGAGADLEGIQSMQANLQAQGVTSNPYARYTAEDMSGRYQKLSDAIAALKSGLAAEEEKQAQRDSLRRQFADKATAMEAFIKSVADALTSVSGELEEQRQQVEQVSGQRAAGAGQFSELQGAAQQLSEAGIVENPLTQLTFEQLDAEWKGLADSIEARLKTINGQIAAKSAGGVSQELLDEFRDVFVFFDTDKSNSLEKHEFKACLASLGEDLDDEQIDALWPQVDPDGDGTCKFDEFVQFMAKRRTDTDSLEEIVDSFKILSNDGETITEEQLRSTLEPEQVEYLLQVMPRTAEGALDYKTFAASIYA